MTDKREDQTEEMEQLSPGELKKEIEKNKRKMTRNIVFIMAAVVALIVICIAWFVSNTRVSGRLGSISADMRSVELRTYGGAGIHDDLLKKVMGSEKTTGSKSFWYELADTVKKYFETSSDKYAINWLLSDTSNVGNYSTEQTDWGKYWENPPQGAERQDEAIEPGSSGDLTFYVVPKYDGEVDLNMNLSLAHLQRLRTKLIRLQRTLLMVTFYSFWKKRQIRVQEKMGQVRREKKFSGSKMVHLR